MNLDIDALRAFVAVADERSFTRAGLAVSRTQSAVSVQIKTFEARLGFALFERTRRSVSLTPRGAQLLAYARDILRLNDDGVRELTGSPAQGRVRLGITEYFAPEQMPALLAQFTRHHPSLTVEVVSGVTGMLRALHKAGELDLVIGRRDLGASDGEPLRRERLRWVARAGFRLAPQAPVPMALLPPGCGVRSLALAALDKQRRPWRSVYCGPSVFGLQAAVAAGLGVACLTRSAIREDFALLGAREGLPALPDSEIVLYGPGRKAAAPMRQITELVREHFTQPIALSANV
jgi:DNA-binding transcriptional LysR family regulator